MMKNCVKRTFFVTILALSLMISFIPFIQAADAASNNYSKAMKKYDVPKDRVIIIDKASYDKISEAFSKASEEATEKSPYIVYVKSGSVKDAYFNVPPNVIFVSEKKVKYNGASLSVNGSVYGGTFDGKNKIPKVISVFTNKFSKVNGNVEFTTVKGATDTGITCIGSARVNSVNNNNVSKCIKGGIGAYSGAVIKYVKKNNVKNIGKGKSGSGINIVGASMQYVEGNSISKCKGHGISTDYDVYKKSCTIKVLDKNKVTSNGVHGIYIERSKVTKSMKGNTVKGNKQCGIRIDAKSSVKGYKNNKVSGNKGTDFSNAGKVSK